MSFDFKKFADQIEGRLNGHCGAYAFVVSYKSDWKVKRFMGKARTKHNPPLLNMSTSVRFHIASVSKAISAAALLKLLNLRTDYKLDDPFHPLLPDHWHVHESLRKVSFGQLLSHTSGLPVSGYGYQSIKNRMAEGINTNDIGTANYAGINYGIIQLLIPRLAKMPVLQLNRSDSKAEILQAAIYSGFYISYVQNEVFKKAGLTKLHCKALPFASGVCYHFPDKGKAGTDFGNQEELAASKGWVMSAEQMAKFFRVLRYTENVLPFWLSKKMASDSLGYFGKGSTSEGVGCYWKNGGFPGSENKGELNSLIIGYDNDIQVALIINSELTNSKGMVGIINEAHDAAYKKTKRLVIKNDR